MHPVAGLAFPSDSRQRHSGAMKGLATPSLEAVLAVGSHVQDASEHTDVNHTSALSCLQRLLSWGP